MIPPRVPAGQVPPRHQRRTPGGAIYSPGQQGHAPSSPGWPGRSCSSRHASRPRLLPPHFLYLRPRHGAASAAGAN